MNVGQLSELNDELYQEGAFEREVDAPPGGLYAISKKSAEYRLGPKPGILHGYNYVLFPDGERRPVLLGNKEVHGLFPGSGWRRIVKARVWSYRRNERVEIEGYIRDTDEGDRLFMSYPNSGQEIDLPGWTAQILESAYGEVVDGMGYHDEAWDVLYEK